MPQLFQCVLAVKTYWTILGYIHFSLHVLMCMKGESWTQALWDFPQQPSQVRNKALAALKEHGVRITSICGDVQVCGCCSPRPVSYLLVQLLCFSDFELIGRCVNSSSTSCLATFGPPHGCKKGRQHAVWLPFFWPQRSSLRRNFHLRT